MTELTPREAIQFLLDQGTITRRISLQTLYAWIRDKRLQARKVPSARGGGPYGRWLIAQESLEKFKPPTRGARAGRPRKPKGERT